MGLGLVDMHGVVSSPPTLSEKKAVCVAHQRQGKKPGSNCPCYHIQASEYSAQWEELFVFGVFSLSKPWTLKY